MAKNSSDELKHFEVVFDGGAWNADIQRTNLHGKRAYTKDVAEISDKVTALDRYDAFRELSIPEEAYRKSSGDYGIAFDEAVHRDGSVLLEHQKAAAKRFLSQLRGFGLLADVVGSGKTFEAGIVLSELAARGRLKSLLIVAPGQVLDSWIDVMENKFGMGKGTLLAVRYEGEEDLPQEKTLSGVINAVGSVKQGKYLYPSRPIIADVEVFSKWHNSGNVVFDAIVVDEAHHFSEEEGEYARAMKLLSEMMAVKKAAGSTYCLLLSATPHSGNLAKMFRLWYFIRCKGGNPSDFEEKEDRERTVDYRNEKKYYLDYICNGAENVSEYIRRAKLDEFAAGKKRRAELDKWLAANGYSDFDGMTEYARSSALDAFLSEEGNEAIKKDVRERVAGSYHNTVLRSIMIRQPNDLPNKKNIFSVLYFPMRRPVKTMEITLDDKSKLSLDYTKTDEYNMPTVKGTLGGDDYKGSLAKYIMQSADKASEMKELYCEIMSQVIATLSKESEDDGIFTKREYSGFYNKVFSLLSTDMWYSLSILPVKYNEGDKLGYKYEYLLKLLKDNPKSRIVVFFDYELPKKKSAADEVTEALLSSEFAKRIIVSDSARQADVIKKFNDSPSAVLVVKKADFTEGANLQSSNIIVNYQVTPDPLAMDQRIGRIFRLGQKYNVFIHSLADINELEGYALGYFSGIGLMNSNNGDATILAGSNSDNMVALRCAECGPESIEIMSRMEYEEIKRKYADNPKDSPLMCYHPHKTHTSAEPMLKEEFSSRDFKCDKCGHTIRRPVDEEGYHCSSVNDEGERGTLCTDERSGAEKRVIYCSKLCAMSHCKYFRKPAMKGKCPVLGAYREQRNVSESYLEMLCNSCTNKACRPKCKYRADVTGIEACSSCGDSGCDPRPYALRFNAKWEADCPACGDKAHGKLKPVVPGTFAIYIRELWKYEHDGGECFCKNLQKEMEHVSEIKEILSLDREDDRTAE